MAAQKGPQAPPSGPADADVMTVADTGTDTTIAGLRHVDAPQHLGRNNRYLICDSQRLVAVWESNGQGWMLKTLAGLLSAARNREQIPVEGNFKLVELRLAVNESGALCLDGITSYQLAHRWALTNLAKGDDHVLATITGPGCLDKNQKNLVRQAIRDQIMYPVWKDSRMVLDYLANTDYHSPGTT
jgi:hypothetical protein